MHGKRGSLTHLAPKASPGPAGSHPTAIAARHLRKLFLLGLTLGGLVLLAGCSGKTTGASNITSDSANLRATGGCDAGETCTWYWEYWPAGSPRVSSSKKTPVQGPFHGPIQG